MPLQGYHFIHRYLCLIARSAGSCHVRQKYSSHPFKILPIHWRTLRRRQAESSLRTLFLEWLGLDQQLTWKVYYEKTLRPVRLTLIRNTIQLVSLSISCKQRIFPKEKTYADTAMYCRMKVLSWIDYSHLEIDKSNRVDEMWDISVRGTIN